ncbi:bifunctional tRNA (5-methylaminomethyl-2-thiouridine)(34)-methyltransferase MnmD/FAD-dependent 5-carboxymethylaminomethyl-2-thiouridine(34) oxidoreductase MnmC [Lentisphaera profundi]|uniref:Bifunctional tRNA (5-methylaminomethyl-2-thiouridine)(34)-methyltransferase MnmD/FAD-dependent 5-carboxymethylaminomethyl-2-thiouridine(34) oxidoreductase MnmC n=1 Tax=Lentisphaera profundi TaxID=1658616 RepID=A0ABY7VXW6_9BACT|nr:bifunctional tRNA (5-methylaminomethyl-2-thiouridine)(34)-methyltransferase MnmD/FAD-dependent 5-carboxymethylaminomethyl-2-thiouridine(34) oxidoreductase MnmC [Lentisphaera profundi]WDE98644.1 bifunctional tRNA (5-methylaminomethyl-2-thiouridine)(34)-methyltransferase MnmD/FAD-dependent 5-carboxymethylaminomethyl-2-thiouridine(34) oxidoreductase MnmC [Lentisphaera profundi]
MNSADNTWTFTEGGTLYSEKFADTYFMDECGLEESRSIFLEGNNFSERLETAEELIVGETGFGTGLNFLAAWDAWRQSSKTCRLIFFSCELYPLEKSLHKKALEPYGELAELAKKLLERLPKTKQGFHLIDFEEGQVQLLLMFGDVKETFKECSLKADAWFLDGFAPSGNPEMWNEDVFRLLANHSKEGTTLATFTAAGFVRRGLADAGFEMKKVPGFRGKRHRLDGKFEPGTRRFAKLELPWYSHQKQTPKHKPVIIGAGIAGTSIAREFKRKNIESIIIDTAGEVATAASGNRRGMIMPLFTMHGNHQEMLTVCGAEYSLQTLKDLDITVDTGALELDKDGENTELYKNAEARHGSEYISVDKQSTYAQQALRMQQSAVIDPLAICQRFFDESGAELIKAEVIKIESKQDLWMIHLSDNSILETDTLIIAAGTSTANLVESIYGESILNLSSLRGQLAYIKGKDLAGFPDLPNMYGDKYLLKDGNDFLLGATFQEDDEDTSLRESDFAELAESLKKLLPDFEGEPEFCGGRTAFRCKSKDYLPVVGPMPDLAYFQETYGGNKRTHAASRLAEAKYMPGLFVASGFGSRGFTTAPLCARMLVEEICHGRTFFPADFRRHLHPAKFTIRKLRRG